jgi:hypothetical protein
MAKSRATSGYEAAEEAHPLLDATRGAQNEPPAHNGITPPLATTPQKPKKPARRMSTGLQTMARIERILGDLDAKTYNAVLTWLKTLETKDVGTIDNQA